MEICGSRIKLRPRTTVTWPLKHWQDETGMEAVEFRCCPKLIKRIKNAVTS